MDTELEYKLRDNFAKALNDFNFKNVHNVMRYLDWTWHNEEQAPTQIQMIEMVEELFEHAIKNVEDTGFSYSASGGFFVTVFESGTVLIHFVVEESEIFE